MTKIDISSTAVEKAIDSIADFANKLVGPAIQETGLIVKDQVSYWRYKNQIRILEKAKAYCEKKGIQPKQIPIKLLAPIISNGGLEEEEELQNKWAIMLSNMVDSEQNIENHVFPHLLSQLSLTEFKILEESVKQYVEKNHHLRIELKTLQARNEARSKTISLELEKVNIELKDFNKKNNIPEGFHYDINVYPQLKRKFKLISIRRDLKSEMQAMENSERLIKNKIIKAPQLNTRQIAEFEIANLVRLGLVKTINRHYAYVESSNINVDYESNSANLEDLDIQIEPEYEEQIITELGFLFIEVCQERESKVIKGTD